MSSHVCIRNWRDSHFPPHKQLIKYDPQIMRETAQLDLVLSKEQFLTLLIISYSNYRDLFLDN